MWIDAPKLSKDMKGIFLLHFIQSVAFHKQKVYTVLHLSDFQDDQQLLRIKNLLAK
jgi:hypothetical protein